MLEHGVADTELLQMATDLRCPTCELRKGPPRPLPARPGTRPVALNMELHIDLKYEKDFKGDSYVALSMVDGPTCFHAAKLLTSRDPAHVAGKLFTGWIAMFGVPVTILSDQGGEFETEFIALLEQHSIGSKVCGSHPPW